MAPDPTLQIFFDEASELLASFEDAVLGLERNSGERELLDAVFRAAHTLKGNSAMLGFDRIAGFTHALEELLARLRAAGAGVTPAIVSTLLAAADVVRALLAQAREEDDRDIDGMEGVLEALAAAEIPGAVATPAGPRVLYEIRLTPSGRQLAAGLDPARVLAALGALGEMLRVDGDPGALPPPGDLEPDRRYAAFTCWLISRTPRAALDACFEFVDAPGTVRIDALDMDDPTAMPATLTPDPTAAGRPAAPGPSPVTSVPAGAARTPVAAPADELASIRVATDKVDRLVNLVGELVITQSMIAQLVEDFRPEALSRLREAVAQMDRHSRELQERVMAVRMLPIRMVFSRFPRLVRDLAQTLGKRVLFRTRGDDTELDKTVIERIADPLTHLVRNAVDHGIEAPGERQAAGKPEAGQLTLSAYQQGGNIYIEVGDDGRGLDRQAIRARAVEQGLLAPADALAEEQVAALILRSGFSTASAVTAVSGRGVGLDVVRRNVEELGGAVSIASAPGAGTTFTIKLPLTLAILDGQVLRVGAYVYVLPLLAITECVRPSAETLSAVLGRGEACIIRGEVLPLFRLHRLFDVADAVEDPIQGLTVIIEHAGRRMALLVDELLGQQQVVIKSLEANFQKIEGIAGATILGDGRVALILDVPGLVSLAARGGAGQPA